METEHIPGASINGREFEFIKDRRNGTKIYSAPDKQSYLRLGAASEIQSELRFHHHLLEQGYPVPKIIEEGEWEAGQKYFLESSAGEEKFGIIFRDDCKNNGTISEETFQSFYKIVKQYLEAQKREKITEKNWESVFIATHFDLLLAELPTEKQSIMAVWEKVKTDLKDAPFVLCHGDFNAFNILPDGVIDFETTFEGPLGYDLISATNSIDWFPCEGEAEILAKYSFTEEQINHLFALAPEIEECFDALNMLRGAWAVVRMHKLPKLQAWRYAKFADMMEKYLCTSSLRASSAPVKLRSPNG